MMAMGMQFLLLGRGAEWQEVGNDRAIEDTFWY